MEEKELKVRPEFDPGGRKAAERANAERERLLAASVKASPVEAPPVEAPVEAAVEPARAPHPAPVGPRWAPGYGPLDLPDRTVEHLRDVTHELLLTLDSAIEAPHGGELVHLLEHARSLLVRAVATQTWRKDVASAAALADATPSAPAAPFAVEASVEAAPVEAPVEAAPVEAAPVEAAPPKAAKK